VFVALRSKRPLHRSRSIARALILFLTILPLSIGRAGGIPTMQAIQPVSFLALVQASSYYRLAFDTTRDGQPEIYSMNADGTDQTNLTHNPGYDLGPFWSPDGQRIAFITYRDGNAEIYVMNADGTHQINASHNPAVDTDPSWPPTIN
jgi:hypothetical protein